jgi:hypothetical protein
VNLENVRKGQFEGLREAALRDPDRSPDIGELRLHPKAGATAVGVRKPLIAYNIYLDTSNVSVAMAIAQTIRYSSGGLPNVKAIGVEHKTRGLAQVSINLTDFEVTPLHRVFQAVKDDAENRGCAVVGSEFIGLVPRKAIEQSEGYDLQLENFSPDRVLEFRLAAVAGILLMPSDLPPESLADLQPLVASLRETVQGLSNRALNSSTGALSASQIPTETRPEHTAESHLGAAFAATEIYERLVQLQGTSATSMLLDWLALKQAAMDAARAALESADALLPSLTDGSTVARIKSGRAEIEAKLSGRPITTEN